MAASRTLNSGQSIRDLPLKADRYRIWTPIGRQARRRGRVSRTRMPPPKVRKKTSSVGWALSCVYDFKGAGFEMVDQVLKLRSFFDPNDRSHPFLQMDLFIIVGRGNLRIAVNVIFQMQGIEIDMVGEDDGAFIKQHLNEFSAKVIARIDQC